MKNEPIKIYVDRESVCATDDVKAHLYVSSDFDDFATKLCAKLPFGKRSRYLGRLQQNAGGGPDGIIVWGKKDGRVLISCDILFGSTELNTNIRRIK